MEEYLEISWLSNLQVLLFHNIHIYPENRKHDVPGSWSTSSSSTTTSDVEHDASPIISFITCNRQEKHMDWRFFIIIETKTNCFEYSPSDDVSSKSLVCCFHCSQHEYWALLQSRYRQTRQQRAGLPRSCYKAPYKIFWLELSRADSGIDSGLSSRALGLYKFDPLSSSLLRFYSLIVGKRNFVQFYSFLSIWHIRAASSNTSIRHYKLCSIFVAEEKACSNCVDETHELLNYI